MTQRWLQSFLDSHGAAHLALMQLFIESNSEADAKGKLTEAIAGASPVDADRLREIEAVWQNSPQAWSTVVRIHHAASRTNDSRPTLEHLRELFDRAAEISPEAGVALYSLGRPDLLDRATAELVSLIQRWDLVARDATVLEIGCGSGRFVRALAPAAGMVLGIDISEAMLR